eukprot:13913994-Ditylum_brightwellii.AAC.1
MRGADCDYKIHTHETTPMTPSSKLPHDLRSPRSSQSYNGSNCSSRGNSSRMSTQRNPETTPPDTPLRSSHSTAQVPVSCTRASYPQYHHPPVYAHHTRWHSNEGNMNTNKPSQPPCY